MDLVTKDDCKTILENAAGRMDVKWRRSGNNCFSPRVRDRSDGLCIMDSIARETRLLLEDRVDDEAGITLAKMAALVKEMIFPVLRDKIIQVVTEEPGKYVGNRYPHDTATWALRTSSSVSNTIWSYNDMLCPGGEIAAELARKTAKEL